MEGYAEPLPEAELASIIREAGALIRGAPDEARERPSLKEGSGNFVTAYDVLSQDLLKRRLSALFPRASFLAEEDGEGRSRADLEGEQFVIDPLDGTANFVCGYPASAVSVALLRRGAPVFGAVYDPYRDEYLSAVAGRGAACNGRPIRVSRRPPERGLAMIGTFPYRKAEFGRAVAEMTGEFLARMLDVRRSGSAALDICAVAAGRADAFAEPCLYPWDYAAALLIVREAGGVGSDFRGRPLSFSGPSSCLFASPASLPVARDIAARAARRCEERGVPLP